MSNVNGDINSCMKSSIELGRLYIYSSYENTGNDYK